MYSTVWCSENSSLETSLVSSVIAIALIEGEVRSLAGYREDLTLNKGEGDKTTALLNIYGSTSHQYESLSSIASILIEWPTAQS